LANAAQLSINTFSIFSSVFHTISASIRKGGKPKAQLKNFHPLIENDYRTHTTKKKIPNDKSEKKEKEIALIFPLVVISVIS
jgi:hypothetical protein